MATCHISARGFPPDHTKLFIASFKASIPCPLTQQTSTTTASIGGRFTFTGKSVLLRTIMRFLAADSVK